MHLSITLAANWIGYLTALSRSSFPSFPPFPPSHRSGPKSKTQVGPNPIWHLTVNETGRVFRPQWRSEALMMHCALQSLRHAPFQVILIALVSGRNTSSSAGAAAGARLFFLADRATSSPMLRPRRAQARSREDSRSFATSATGAAVRPQQSNPPLAASPTRRSSPTDGPSTLGQE